MRCSVRLSLLTFTLLPLGCGGSGGGPPLAKVSGRVQMDGKPLANATVTFTPIGDDGKPTSGPNSTGVTGEDGRFTLKSRDGKEGAVVGKHRVDISQIDRERKPMNSVPEQYNVKSRLTFPVPEGGTTEANFDLKNK